ncbi:MAG: aminoglycoside 6-adenylyltransferase [Melioribacter sp.]|uniref:aminoglycoside 6-adenylyltransferase n=1 Tax=Rosettibacter primus TaxID=3111523 RepID=UPI00247F0545|nr:aminoglycoside 6-adenylyltransferase [Melioribacter sp.]
METSINILSKLEKNFIQWAKSQNDIRAVIIFGSQARKIFPADEWSDIDFMIYAINIKQYIQKNDWLSNIGNILISLVNLSFLNQPGISTLFEDGKNIDFFFQTVKELENMVNTKTLPFAFQRGFRVILDKDGLAKQLNSFQKKPQYFFPPSNEIYIRTVNMYWYQAYHIAKQLFRNELWHAKVRDAYLKESLLTMIQWHAGVKSNWSKDVWHMGKFIDEWADTFVLEKLNSLFGHYNLEDSWKTLFASNDLFRQLAREVAKYLNYSYPEYIEKRVSHFISIF